MENILKIILYKRIIIFLLLLLSSSSSLLLLMLLMIVMIAMMMLMMMIIIIIIITTRTRTIIYYGDNGDYDGDDDSLNKVDYNDDGVVIINVIVCHCHRLYYHSITINKYELFNKFTNC